MAEPFDDTALFPVILTPEIFECLACFFGCLPELLVVFPNERYRFGSTFFAEKFVEKSQFVSPLV